MSKCHPKTGYHPLITVITVVYNAVHSLEMTIKSVINQDDALQNIEYVIIDGCSTDGTIQILEKFDKNIDFWVSEPDNGIYDAMNKAINKSSGKWLYFLGADDTLEPNIISKVTKYLDDPFVLIYGDVRSSSGKVIPSFLNRRTLLQNTLHHQGAFYNMRLFSDFRYDTNLKILSDYELNLKIYADGLPTKRIPLVIACCRAGGESSNVDLSVKETNFIRSRFLGNGYYNKLLSLILKLYYKQKYIRNSILYFFS